jgi:hypothetical protein
MAVKIDRCEWTLSQTPKAMFSLGLGHTRPKEPFNHIYHGLFSQLATAFLCAVIVDRILWALCIGILEPFTQYLHHDFDTEISELDLSRFHPFVHSIGQNLAICEGISMEFPDTLSGDNLRCGISSVKHEILGALNNVASQLYFAATTFLLLGSVS